MQNWLAAGLEAIETELPECIIDIRSTPSDLLDRQDIGRCLTDGIAVAIGTAAVGSIRGPKLAQMLAAACRQSLREAEASREEIRRLRRDRSMLAATLTHELRTTVNAISGYSELVALGLSTGRTVSAVDQNAVIWEAAQSLLGTIDAVLDVARIDAGAAHLDETEFSVRTLAQVVERMLATLVQARDATLTIDIPDDLPLLFADMRMIRQVLVNLVGNAIKYGGELGVVTVKASIDRQERMVIEVRDIGAGMSGELIARAMQTFRRGTNEPPTIPGSGLGLPMVKMLVELHEGSFRLISSVGKGTRAIITLPTGRVCIPRPGRQEAFAFQRSGNLLT